MANEKPSVMRAVLGVAVIIAITVNMMLLQTEMKIDAGGAHLGLSVNVEELATALGEEQPSLKKKARSIPSALLRKVQEVHTNTTMSYKRYYKDPLPRMHPFAGALDEHRRFGYIHDETLLSRKRKQQDDDDIQLSMKSIQRVCEGIVDRNLTYYAKSKSTNSILNKDARRIINKIRVLPVPSLTPSPRILCIVYTYQGNEENIRAISQTWGARCDGFLAASNHTDPTIGAVHIPHFGKEASYRSIWQKVRSILAYVYEHYLDDYDFFHVLGDDTYVILENLRALLSSLSVRNTTATVVGAPIKPNWKIPGLDSQPNKKFFYYAGGPGYTMNRAALELFASRGLAECHPNKDLSFEDLLISLCFDTLMGPNGMKKVFASTADEIGAPRYHSQDPNDILYPVDKAQKKFMKKQRAWRIQTLGEPEDALDAISNTSAIFHLIKTPDYIRRLDVAFYPKDGRIAQYCRRQRGGGGDAGGRG